MVKLACAEGTFGALPLDKVAPLLSLLEFEGIELALVEGRSRLQPSQMQGREAKVGLDTSRLLARHGLVVANVAVQAGRRPEQLAPNHPDPAERERGGEIFRRMIEFAANAGALQMTGVAGSRFEGQKVEDDLKRAAEAAAHRAEWARAASIRYQVLPHWGNQLMTAAGIESLSKGCGEAKLAFDIAAAVATGWDSSALVPQVSQATHLYLRAAAPDRWQVPKEENAVDLPALAQLWRQTSYGGWVSVHYGMLEGQAGERVDCLTEVLWLREECQRLMRGPEPTNPMMVQAALKRGYGLRRPDLSGTGVREEE